MVVVEIVDSRSCICSRGCCRTRSSLVVVIVCILWISLQILVDTPYCDALVSFLINTKNITGLLMKTLEGNRQGNNIIHKFLIQTVTRFSLNLVDLLLQTRERCPGCSAVPPGPPEFRHGAFRSGERSQWFWTSVGESCPSKLNTVELLTSLPLVIVCRRCYVTGSNSILTLSLCASSLTFALFRMPLTHLLLSFLVGICHNKSGRELRKVHLFVSCCYHWSKIDHGSSV